jgi:hypothetical protein
VAVAAVAALALPRLRRPAAVQASADAVGTTAASTVAVTADGGAGETELEPAR